MYTTCTIGYIKCYPNSQLHVDIISFKERVCRVYIESNTALHINNIMVSKFHVFWIYSNVKIN